MQNINETRRPSHMASPSLRLRAARSMPQWMQARGNSVPAPPPPINSGDPDYEVIEFPGQQYSNSPPPIPQRDGQRCDLCGSPVPSVCCEKCNRQNFCFSCDDMYHRHPKRQSHIRKPLDVSRQATLRPPLPPKGETNSAPVPPPRRNKRGGRLLTPTPPDQINKKPMTGKNGSFMGSLKRMMGGRPLPPAPPLSRNLHQGVSFPSPMSFKEFPDHQSPSGGSRWDVDSRLRSGSLTALHTAGCAPLMQAQSMAQLNCPSCHHHGLIWDWNQNHMNVGLTTPWNGLPTNTWHGSAMLPPYHPEHAQNQLFRRNSLRQEPRTRRSHRDLNSDDEESDFHTRRNISPVSSRRGLISDESDDDIRSHRSSRRSRRRNSPVSPVMSRRGSSRKGSIVEDIIARRAKRNEEESKAKQDFETMSNIGGKRYDEDNNSNRVGRRYDKEIRSNRGVRRNDEEITTNRARKRNNFDEISSGRENRSQEFKHEFDEDLSDSMSNRGGRRKSDNNFFEKGRNYDRSEDLSRQKRVSDTNKQRLELTVLSRKSSPVLQNKYRRSLSNNDFSNELSDKIVSDVNLTDEEEKMESKVQLEDQNRLDETKDSLPKIPTEAWECEHCTFVNKAGTRVCVVCCKTKDINKEDSKNNIINKSNKTNMKEADYSEIDLAERLQKQLTISSPEITKTKGEKTNRKLTASTGTSPPPQSISTQTYEVLPKPKLKRTPSLALQEVGAQGQHSVSSGQSVTSDSQSLPLTPPEWDNHQSSWESRSQSHLGSRQSPWESRSQSQLDRRISEPAQTLTRPLNRRAGSHPPEYITSLVQTQVKQGLEMVKLLREAEEHGFTADDLSVALAQCGEGNPVQWLKDNWQNMIDTVVTLATNYGHERKENTVGTISASEAREALRLHSGNVWVAVTECVQQRQKKYADLLSRGNFTREDIVTVLTANHGNLDAAYLDLSKNQLKPFLMRIWGPPQGTDNESGNRSNLEKLDDSELIDNRDDLSTDEVSVKTNTSEESRFNRIKSWLDTQVEVKVENNKHMSCSQINVVDSDVKTSGSRSNSVDNEPSPSLVLSSVQQQETIEKAEIANDCDRLKMIPDVSDNKETVSFHSNNTNIIENSENLQILNEKQNQYQQIIVEKLIVDGKIQEVRRYILNPDEVNNVTKTRSISNDAVINLEEQEDIPKNSRDVTISNVSHPVVLNTSEKEAMNLEQFSLSDKDNELIISQSFDNILSTLNESLKNSPDSLNVTNLVNTEQDKLSTSSCDSWCSTDDVIDSKNNKPIEIMNAVTKGTLVLSISNPPLSRDKKENCKPEQVDQYSEKDEINKKEIPTVFNELEAKDKLLSIKALNKIILESNTNEEIEEQSVPHANIDRLGMDVMLTGIKCLNIENHNAPGKIGIIQTGIANSNTLQDSGQPNNSTVETKSTEPLSYNQLIPISLERLVEYDSSGSESDFGSYENVIDFSNTKSNYCDSKNSFQSNELNTASSITPDHFNKESEEKEGAHHINYDIENDINQIELANESTDKISNNLELDIGGSEGSVGFDNPEKLVFKENSEQIPPDTSSPSSTNTTSDISDRLLDSVGSDENSPDRLIDSVDLNISQQFSNFNKETSENSEKVINSDCSESNSISDFSDKLQSSYNFNKGTPTKSEVLSDPVSNKSNSYFSYPDKLLGSNQEPLSSHSIKLSDSISPNKENINVLTDSNITFHSNSEQSTNFHNSDKLLSNSGDKSELKPSPNLNDHEENFNSNKNISFNDSDTNNSLNMVNSNKISKSENYDSKENSDVGSGGSKGSVCKTESSTSSDSRTTTSEKSLSMIESRNEILELLKESLSNDSVVDRIVNTLFASVLGGSKSLQNEQNRLDSYEKQVPSKAISNSSISSDSEINVENDFYEAHEEVCEEEDSEENESVCEDPDINQIETKETENNQDEEYHSEKTNVILLNEENDDSFERQVRRCLAEGLVSTYGQAELAVHLMEMKFDQQLSVAAALECSSVQSAMAYLQQECQLCTGKYPMNQMVSMLECEHRCCRDCALHYFTLQISERSINECTCPFCKEPDVSSLDADQALGYFSNLDILLKGLLEETVHELFQRKLRDRTLMQDPHFKWCIKCSSGFIANPHQKRLVCPDCRSVTCASCRRPWEKQHEGITCEEFAAWLEFNDPEKQLDRHLADHGVSCPNCQAKYSLSRGGCMHLTCPHCKYEFCSGCAKPFSMGAKCQVSDYCAKLGLHAHHPRNCLFYLRDKEPALLQKLLNDNGVAYNEEPSGKEVKCTVQLQRETPEGLMDGICGLVVEQAGLCRTHYIEYLVKLIVENKLDPVAILDLTEVQQELRRRGKALPIRASNLPDQDYLTLCAKAVQEEVPLN